MAVNAVKSRVAPVAAARDPVATLAALATGELAGKRAAASQSANSSNSALLARAALAALAIWMLIESWDIAASIIEQREGGWLAAATAAAIMLSALVSSIAGFAFSAIAGSALAYLGIEPTRAVHTMVICSIATQLYAVWSIRNAIRWRSVLPIAGAGAMTVPFGVWMLLHVDPLVYIAGLGLFLTTYGCYLALRRDSCVARESGWYDAFAGALGGLAGGLAGIPGAPVTVWCSMRGWDKLTQRAVYQPYILAMQIVTLVCLHWGAPQNLSIAHNLSLLPFAILGAIGGLAIFRLMNNRQFQVAISMLLLVSGMGLLGRCL